MALINMFTMFDVRTCFGFVAFAASILHTIFPSAAYKMISRRSLRDFLNSTPGPEGAKQGEYLSLPGISHVAGWLACFIIIVYGLSNVSSHNFQIAALHVPGFISESFYIIIFFIYASTHQKAYMAKMLVAAVLCFVVTILLPILTIDQESARSTGLGITRREACGGAGVSIIHSFVLICFNLTRTREMEHATGKPIYHFQFLALASQVSWLIYSILGHDIFLTITYAMVASVCVVMFFARTSAPKETTYESFPEEDVNTCSQV